MRVSIFKLYEADTLRIDISSIETTDSTEIYSVTVNMNDFVKIQKE